MRMTPQTQIIRRIQLMTTKITLEGFVGEVYDWMADELKTTSYKGMESKLKDVTGDIELHINSKGGDAFEGMAIMNSLKNYTGGSKTAIVDGFCASAATLPLFAMDTVKAHETTMFVFHKSGTMAFGHSSDLRKAADELDTIDGAVTELYMKRFTGTEEELNALLDEDKIITAKQALEYGFIDEIVQDVKEPETDEDDPTFLEDDQKVSLESAVDIAKAQAEETSNRLDAFAMAIAKFVE